MKLIRVIVIDPVAKLVEERMIPPTYEAARFIIGNIIEAVDLGRNLTLWIDEEGLLDRHKHGFYIGNIEQPFMGPAFIAGDFHGEMDSLPAWMIGENIRNAIKFYEGPSPEPVMTVTTFESVDDLMNHADKQRSQE